MSNYAPTFRVLYVPTLATYTSKPPQEIQGQTRTIQSEGTTVQEKIVEYRHDEWNEWLVPGIAPNGKKAKFVMVTITTYNHDNLITDKKMYWDHATVLAQLDVLPRNSLQQLPIITNGENLVNAFRGDKDAEFNIFANKSLAKDQEVEPSKGSVQSLGSQEESKPAGKAHYNNQDSNIFGSPTSVQEEHKSRAHYNAPKSSIFSDSPVPDAKHIQRDPRNYETHFSIGDRQDVEPSNDRDSMFGRGKRHSERDNASDLVMGGVQEGLSNMTMQPTETIHHTYHNQSHFTLGGMVGADDGKPENDDQPTDAIVSQKKIFAGKHNESNFILGGGMTAEPAVRPSSRVLRAPGGGSTFSFAY